MIFFYLAVVPTGYLSALVLITRRRLYFCNVLLAVLTSHQLLDDAQTALARNLDILLLLQLSQHPRELLFRNALLGRIENIMTSVNILLGLFNSQITKETRRETYN